MKFKDAYLYLSPSLVGLLTAASVFGADLGEQDDGQEPWFGFARCGALNDSLAGGSVEGRLQWSQNCYPKGKRYYTMARQAIISGQRVTLYPTFGVFDAANNPLNPRNYQGATDPNAVCNLPSDYRVVALCIPGCFTPDQKLKYAQGEMEIGQAARQKLSDIITLDARSTLGAIRTKASAVANYVTDLREGEQTVLDFRMKSGGTLTVTEKHPMLDAEGGIRLANTFQAGDFLVREDGKLDEIESATGRTFFGKVHNVSTANSAPIENIVVSQGYLTGSWYFQNLAVDHINRVLMRENLPETVLN